MEAYVIAQMKIKLYLALLEKQYDDIMENESNILYWIANDEDIQNILEKARVKNGRGEKRV